MKGTQEMAVGTAAPPRIVHPAEGKHLPAESLAGTRGGPAQTRGGGVLALLVRLLLLWQERSNERMKLLEMDEHMLKDIGVSRSMAEQEADKPFWRS